MTLRSLSNLLICVVVCALGACGQLPPRPDYPPEVALAPGAGGRLDSTIGPAEAQHPGQSAFRLVVEGNEAFLTRAQSTRVAVRSIDVQTYLWRADLTGMVLAQLLLDAADRGVRVRLLLDDMDARAKNAGLAALAAHPRISVRLFNPFISRWGGLLMLGEGVLDFDRLNRRMHNKSWIADNRLALVGGRNIGDEYFSASDDVNFVDLDYSMIGPVVRDVSASFDRYWNSAAAYSMEQLDPEAVNTPALEKLRVNLADRLREANDGRYVEALRSDDAVRRLVAGDWTMQWTAKYKFVADDPRKIDMADGDVERAKVALALAPLMRDAQKNIVLISPYFVPGVQGTRGLVKSAEGGRQVRVLTNSLAANDVAAVHGGYARYRRSLLEGGVQLWELKPLQSGARASAFGSSGASLHTKALAVDGHTLFVGSYNVDPRSTWLNCEQGVLVESPELARQLDDIFARQTDGKHAWRVTLQEDSLHWSDDKEQFDSDPKASMWRRFQSWIIRTLGMDSQL